MAQNGLKINGLKVDRKAVKTGDNLGYQFGVLKKDIDKLLKMNIILIKVPIHLII